MQRNNRLYIRAEWFHCLLRFVYFPEAFVLWFESSAAVVFIYIVILCYFRNLHRTLRSLVPTQFFPNILTQNSHRNSISKPNFLASTLIWEVLGEYLFLDALFSKFWPSRTRLNWIFSNLLKNRFLFPQVSFFSLNAKRAITKSIYSSMLEWPRAIQISNKFNDLVIALLVTRNCETILEWIRVPAFYLQTLYNNI